MAVTETSVTGGAREAMRRLRAASATTRNQALLGIAEAIRERAAEIEAANGRDLADARGAGTSDALLDRLTLDAGRIEALAAAAEAVAALPDPVGALIGGRRLPNGLELTKVRVPLGRILVVYESRPNVTVDVACLCLKSGNVALLRGASSSRRTDAVLVAALREGIAAAGLPEDAVVQLALSREELAAFVGDAGNAEVVVPRGGEQLKHFLLEHSRIPVLVAAGGVCHLYLDASAEPEMAEAILLNAKVQRPGVCNAVETLLVHADQIDRLPRYLAALAAAGVRLHGDDRALDVAPEGVGMEPATEDDWAREYLDLELAVRVVDSVDEAIEHIERYSTGHSEAIVTRDLESADRFVAGVDSACVYVNASTRFTDGGEFGFGAEIGNSTSRLHARGPLGLEELTTFKWIGRGSGQVRG
jgi:glutamate-5-semialdehyde dehydrogenase